MSPWRRKVLGCQLDTKAPAAKPSRARSRFGRGAIRSRADRRPVAASAQRAVPADGARAILRERNWFGHDVAAAGTQIAYTVNALPPPEGEAKTSTVQPLVPDG